MSKFRIHNSFEEELAKKADEFSLQPRMATWRGVDRGVQKAQSIKQAIRFGIVSTCAIITIAVAYFQSNQDSERIEQNPVAQQISPNAKAGIPSGLSSNTQENVILPNQSNTQQNFTHFRSLPGFENSESSPLQLENTEQSATENASLSLQSVTPKHIAFSLAHKETDQANVKRRKRPISIRHKDAWYIQASFTPSIAYRSISARTAYAEPFKNEKDKYDQSIKSYSAQVGLRYFFSDRFSLGFGLRYSQKGEIIGMGPRKENPYYNALAEDYEYNPIQMNSLGNSLSHLNQYHYMEVPVTLYAKRAIGKRLSLHTGLGLSLGYLVKETSRIYDFRVDHYVENDKFLRSWAVGAHAQVNLGYDINTRWMLSFGPEVNYALLSTYQNYYTLSQHQYTLGLNFGVQWKLFDGTKSRAFGSN